MVDNKIIVLFVLKELYEAKILKKIENLLLFSTLYDCKLNMFWISHLIIFLIIRIIKCHKIV